MGFRVRKGKDIETIVGFATRSKTLFIDRSRSGAVIFHKDFLGRHVAKLQENSQIKLHLFVDRSSVEVFGNDGEVTMTDRIYPPAGSDGFEIYSDGARAKVVSLKVWSLDTVWTH